MTAIDGPEPILASWRVSEVLRRYPALLQTLLGLSPAFGHLRNSIVRRVQTRLVAVAQATRAARLELAALVRAQHRGGPRAGTQIVPSNRRDCHASGPGDVRAR